jgi:hypothetical protein
MANEIYNTTWWGNAIDTAITAGTEPDFFGSQMKMLTSQQPELVTNGDFATDSNWTKGTGWTISGGEANYVSGVTTALYQLGLTLTSGKTYILKFSISNAVGNSEIWTGNSSGSVNYFGVSYQNYANGDYTLQFTMPSTQTSIAFFARNFNFSIDNVSVKLARAEEVEAVKCLADWIHTTALQDLNN